MATVRSVLEGFGIAAGGAAAGYVFGSGFDYISKIGMYDHLNEFNHYVSYGLNFAGFAVAPIVGAYHAFRSNSANPAPTNAPQNPQNACAPPRNVTIHVRGGRNRFRF